MARPLFKVNMVVDGIEDLLAEFDKLARSIQREALEAMDEWTRLTFNLSQERVPVKSGALRASGEQIKARFIRGRRGIESAIVYKQKYALEQHEVPYTHQHGQWKYLSSAIEERRGDLTTDLANAIGVVI